MSFPARYPGWCKICRNKFRVDDPIEKHGYGWAHARCTTKTEFVTHKMLHTTGYTSLGAMTAPENDREVYDMAFRIACEHCPVCKVIQDLYVNDDHISHKRTFTCDKCHWQFEIHHDVILASLNISSLSPLAGHYNKTNELLINEARRILGSNTTEINGSILSLSSLGSDAMELMKLILEEHELIINELSNTDPTVWFRNGQACAENENQRIPPKSNDKLLVMWWNVGYDSIRRMK